MKSTNKYIILNSVNGYTFLVNASLKVSMLSTNILFNTDLNLNNNIIFNVPNPVNSDHIANKGYADNNFWSTSGNTLTTAESNGSLNNFDIKIIRNSQNIQSLLSNQVTCTTDFYITGNKSMGCTFLDIGQTFAIKFNEYDNSIIYQNSLNNNALWILLSNRFEKRKTVIRKLYVDDNIVVETNFDLNNKIMYNVPDLFNPDHVANKAYVDTKTVGLNTTFLPLAGGTVIWELLVNFSGTDIVRQMGCTNITIPTTYKLLKLLI